MGVIRQDYGNIIGSSGIPDIVDFVATTGGEYTLNITGNSESTLYALLYSSSSTQSVRETNATITASTGCNYEKIDEITNNTTYLSIYKLTNCQSSLSITTGSGSSSTGKNILIFKTT